jgi:hypothetical protein
VRHLTGLDAVFGLASGRACGPTAGLCRCA